MHEEVFPLESSKYKLEKIIGQGATATVYVAKCLTNDVNVAIKLIDLEACPIEIETLRSEIAFWSSCDHPNIVKYYGSFIEKSTLYIVMEYMDIGSVLEIMKFGFHNGIPKEGVIAAILKEVLNALAYFHNNKQIHRDIKSGNILINSKGNIKLADFGIAAKLIERGQSVQARFTVIGTPCFMAPEVVTAGLGYTEKADIWSLGITAIEIATGKVPYSDLHPLEVIIRISNSPPPTLPDRFSSSFRDFVKCALNPDSEQRPTALELLNHSFIKKAANQKVLNDLFGSVPPIHEQYELIHSSKHKKEVIVKNICTDWNFSDASNEPNIENDEEENQKEKSDVNTEIVQKGKFKITKRTLENLPSDNDIVLLMKTKISQMKEAIKKLRNENILLNQQIDDMFNELAPLII